MVVVGEGWRGVQEQVGVDKARHTRHFLAGIGSVSQETAGGASAASQSVCGPKNGQEEASGGKAVLVRHAEQGHLQQEKAGWVPLAYSLGELLMCESSVPKPERQAVRGLQSATITFPTGASRLQL